MPAPHPPLPEYYKNESERQGWVKQLFDRTAGDYDRIESFMALGSGSWYRRRALSRAGLKPGMKVLDIGVGTGLTARQAQRLVGDSGQVIGVDPSPGMLERARLPERVELVIGSAEAIPAASASADFLSMGYALRHIGDLAAAFKEFMRVLVPGGQVCLLEITPPAGKMGRALLKTYMRTIVPFMARCLAADAESPRLMRYYWDTIEACAPPQSILQSMRDAGFVAAHRYVELGIFSEYRALKPPLSAAS
jgi:demethylmenaquinone methyltransferase / 2-methoxy-6-polyprenyl-1,4-benzoquinol methylase